jgi:hypothetical protein
MADEKKPAGKSAAPPPKASDPFVEIIGFLFLVMLVGYLFNGLAGALSGDSFAAKAYQSIFPNASSTGPVPLSEEGILLSHSRPIASLINPIGTNVVALDSTAVFDSPGGTQIGTQKINARGEITRGPAEVNGDTYYFVQFASGKSGWVKESDIAYLQSQPTPAENFLISIYSSVSFFEILSILLSLILIGWAAYIVVKLTALRKKEHEIIYPETTQAEVDINPKWRRVLSHLESQNESDWKLAIIEADIMLDEILDKLQLPGETMGDKMKEVEKSDFSTIDNAWEAHKVRNQIAHEGVEYVLTQHEARRVVALYQSVFEEFQIL